MASIRSHRRCIAHDAFQIRVVKANDDAVLGGAQVGLRRHLPFPRPAERFERVLGQRDAGAAVSLNVKRRVASLVSALAHTAAAISQRSLVHSTARMKFRHVPSRWYELMNPVWSS